MRRLLLILFAACAGLGLLALTLPWWLGPAARFAAGTRGIGVGAYERIGYSRFAFHDVVVPAGSVRVTAARVEADTPLLWAWRHWRRQDAPVIVGTWRVEVGPPAAPSDPARARGWMPLRGLLDRIAGQLDRWLRQAQVGAGVVRWPGDELRLEGATWQARALTVDDLRFRGVTADVTASFAPAGEIRVQARTTDAAAEADLTSRGTGVSGNARLWEQPAALGATFAATGWLPAEASLRASDWAIPGEKLRIGAAYPEVRGGANLSWGNALLTVELDARASPEPGRSLPPLEVALRAAGDAAGFKLDTLRLEVPGISGLLTEPVFVERSGRLREGRARFTVTADLAQVPWFSARGTVAGEARVVSGATGTPPVVEFAFAAADVAASDVPVSAASVSGQLAWPRLEIATLELGDGHGSAVRGRGGWNLQGKELQDVAVTGTVRRATLARWLPAQPGFEQLELEAAASGPLAELVHRGTLQVKNLTQPGLRPVAVAAEWQGRGRSLDAWQTEARAGASVLSARGTLTASALTLTAAALRQGDHERLALAAPAVVTWQPALHLERLDLTGPAGRIQVQVTAGETGRVAVTGGGVAADWLRDFVVLPGPAWTVRRLTLAGDWDRGPARFTLDTGVALEIGDDRTALVELRGRGAADGLHVEQLRIAESEGTVVEASGRLPIALVPGAAEPLRIDRKGALTVVATVAPHAVFWQKFAALTGVNLEEPRVQADLHGTWDRPEGRAILQAARVAIEPRWTSRPLPVIEGLDVALDGDRAGLNLTRFQVRVAGQAVQAGGRLPVPEDRWRDLLARPLAVARNGADLRLEVPDADLAAFAALLPPTIAPVGRLHADVRFRQGGLSGFVRLRDAASRPLGPLGVLQEISADVALSGQRFRLENVAARSGGQPVSLTGEIELGDDGTPRFDLALRGSNLPFVRQTGLLVRGDLDLQLQTPAAGAPARLSGTVRLRDSLFLSDVRGLLPQGGAGPTRRPPYFAVETPPVNAWTLAVEVTGERFLRVRIPVFTGLASARFRLTGTLGEPRATGEIVIDEGAIKMPFAAFTVTQGSVRLTEADALEPEVYMRGTGRRYGYDLTLQIEGRASQPNVVFSSSPALESEQVLLMVMTGSAPGNEIARSATQRAANLGLFLGQSLLSGFGADAAEAERLTIMSGEKVSQQGRETYEFEYQLSDRWTLTGEYNEFDEYNAGVKWRVFGGRRPTAQSHEPK